MAPGPDGGLFVSIPGPKGSVVVARLDSTGRLRPGFPIGLADATSCGLLLPVDDGSVRVLCSPSELNQELNTGSRAFAFDPNGNLLAGWPIDLNGRYTGRMIGDELTLLGREALGDVVEEGKPSYAVWLDRIAADGTRRSGTRIPIVEGCCLMEWAVGPDGIAYGVEEVSGFDQESPEVSRITALTPPGYGLAGRSRSMASHPGPRSGRSVGSS